MSGSIPTPPKPTPLPAIRVDHVEDNCGKSLRIPGSKKHSNIFKLTHAIEDDSVDSLAALINDGRCDVNTTLSFGVSILHKAVRNRSTQVAEYLIEKGADCKSSVFELMRKPVGLEATFNKRYDSWSTAMLIKMLPKVSDVDLQEMVDGEGRNLLHLACYFPNSAVFDSLLKRGLDPNWIDDNGACVLTVLISHSAKTVAYKMASDLVKLNTTQVDIRNRAGATPLFVSLLFNRMEIFYLLLEHGANPFVRTYSGNTLMHYPFLDNERILVLYDIGLDLNAVNKVGQRPLQHEPIVCFTQIFLGRFVSDEEFEKLKDLEVVSFLKHRIQAGEFSHLRLQSLCRRRIRSILFKVNRNTITDNIWQLPLPKPLKLYLDVKLYIQYLIDSLGCVSTEETSNV